MSKMGATPCQRKPMSLSVQSEEGKCMRKSLPGEQAVYKSEKFYITVREA